MKKIPSIHQPIQRPDGSIEYVWYLFLQWVSENAGATDLSNYFTKEETQALLDAKANTDDLADVAFSGSYNDLSNKPTIGNATITITQGGTTKGTFTTNQGENTTIELDAGGGSIDAIDDLTITKNSDDEIQAVATINANTAVSATNPVYDWVGTLAEYQAQNIETLHPDWICYITDDVSAGASVYTKTEVDNNFVGKGHEVIAFQAPTAQNNYTWYRKYADGWVEQGGISNDISVAGNSGTNVDVTLPITMADTNYNILTTRKDGGSGFAQTETSTNILSTSVMRIVLWNNVSSAAAGGKFWWQVSGMAA